MLICLSQYLPFDAINDTKSFLSASFRLTFYCRRTINMRPFFWYFVSGFFFLQCFCIQITNCDVGVFDRVTGACNPVPGQSAGTYGGKLCNIPNQLPIHTYIHTYIYTYFNNFLKKETKLTRHCKSWSEEAYFVLNIYRVCPKICVPSIIVSELCFSEFGNGRCGMSSYLQFWSSTNIG